MAMAAVALPPLLLHAQLSPFLPPSRGGPRPIIPKLRHTSLRRRRSIPAPRFARPLSGKPNRRAAAAATAGAYVTGQASDPISEPSFKFDEWSSDQPQPRDLISRGLLWSLLLKHKLRLGIAVLTLVGCSTCTLAMPLFSGQFFEVLVGARPEPLRRLLAKIGLLYMLEPVFTVLFVVNMNTIWEKVMSTMRAQIFRRVLIQKVEFFDRYKVGELTGLLTSDLGALKDVVSENVSRDRGFRALSEVVGTVCILFTLSPELAPILGFLMLSVSAFVAVYKRSTVPVFKAHGLAQASISDCVSETFSAIRTVGARNSNLHLNFI